MPYTELECWFIKVTTVYTEWPWLSQVSDRGLSKSCLEATGIESGTLCMPSMCFHWATKTEATVLPQKTEEQGSTRPAWPPLSQPVYLILLGRCDGGSLLSSPALYGKERLYGTFMVNKGTGAYMLIYSPLDIHPQPGDAHKRGYWVEHPALDTVCALDRLLQSTPLWHKS